MGRPKSYQVLITPLVSRNVYGSVVDITQDVDLSDYVKKGGIGKIKGEIDNGDYDIGVFTYSNITLKTFNYEGRFNDEKDFRSIFPYSRDKAKVHVKFFDSDSTATISFKGLITEEATRQDFGKNEVKFKVLSYDSVIRKTKVAGGLIQSGALFSTAIKAILNQTDITAVLNYDASEIVVDKDLTIDVGSWFDDKNAKDALDVLLAVSNSVMVIDRDTDTMIVRSRSANTNAVFNFYGHSDNFGRENIIDIKKFNSGIHRSFNSVVVNEIEQGDTTFSDLYGTRQKVLDMGFITNDSISSQVASNTLLNWKVPKMEMELVTDTETAKGLNFFDLISIDYNYVRFPTEGEDYLPIYGTAKYGTDKYPYMEGHIKISPRFAFKVVGIKEDPKKFTTTLKLRQIGITVDDGLLSNVITVYGDAFYGSSRYQEDTERIDPNYNSVFGAGLYGTVRYGAILPA